jgi:hypothetical protein
MPRQTLPCGEAHRRGRHDTGPPLAEPAINAATLLALIVSALILIPWPAAWADDAEPADDSPWYFLVGSVNNQPKLKDASRQIDRQTNKLFRFFAPGFDDVTTFSDERDDMMIWSPYVGVGRVLSDHWDVFFQAGYSAGKVRSNETNLTWLLLFPLHTDVRFERSSFFAGVGAAYYPFGMVEREDYGSIRERLRHAKPFFVSTLNWNYLTFDANIKSGVGLLDSLVTIKQSDAWDPWSVGISAGVDIPVTKHSTVSMNLQYNHFIDQTDDFSGPGFNIYWKRFF